MIVVAQNSNDSKPAEKPKPEFPSLDEVTEGYEKVVSTADGEKSYYTVWTREKDGQILAALPSGYENKKFFMSRDSYILLRIVIHNCNKVNGK